MKKDMNEQPESTGFSKNVLKTGLITSFPIIVGYIPIGFAFGVMAEKAGISAFNTVLMSLIVFAGSSQLIAVGLILAGVSTISIIITTFIVNLRHMLMAAALSPFLKKWKKSELTAFSYQITDETFAIHSERFANNNTEKQESLVINMSAQASWVFGTIIGVIAGSLISDVKPLGLDYVLSAMFIGLLVFQLKSRFQVIVAVLSGIMSVLSFLAGIEQWNVILATLAGATIGVFIEKWIKN